MLRRSSREDRSTGSEARSCYLACIESRPRLFVRGRGENEGVILTPLRAQCRAIAPHAVLAEFRHKLEFELLAHDTTQEAADGMRLLILCNHRSMLEVSLLEDLL